MAATKQQIEQYEATIGIECHVQLKTKTKLFAGVDNDAREAQPNTLVSPICFGLPGALPVLNKEAVALAVQAGLAMNCDIAEFSKFDRKHYFYPDLPMGYQITQFDQPIVGRGSIDVPLGDEQFTVGITRAHMEADAGKSTHPSGATYSLVDLNRAGTPLLEIVSEPDMHTAQQARAYARELYFLMKYADVSEVDLYHGNMRFDVNVSVAKKGSSKLGTRTETKNLNSFRSIEKAVEYEIARQVDELERGNPIKQETRGWDDAKAKTVAQRDKEDAHDYRYFPDADLPPIVLEPSQIDAIRANMPILPPEIRQHLRKAGVANERIDVILDNSDWVGIILVALDERPGDTKAISKITNWLVSDVKAEMTETSHVLTYAHMSELYDLVSQGKLSSTGAKEVLVALLRDGGSAHDLAKQLNLIQVSDDSAIEKLVDQVIAENEQAVADVKAGEAKAIGFLVGQVMKLSQGQANPGMVNTLLRAKLK